MTVHMQVEAKDATPTALCGAERNKFAVLTTSSVEKDVDCFDCVLLLEVENGKKTYDFSFRMQDALPLGYMIDADCAVPTTPVPVYAMVDGKKMQIGEGTIDPKTFLFSAKVDGSDAGKKVMEYIRGTRDKEGKTGAGMIEVSEVTLKAGVDTPPTDGAIGGSSCVKG